MSVVTALAVILMMVTLWGFIISLSLSNIENKLEDMMKQQSEVKDDE